MADDKFYSTNGDEYSVSFNTNGAVLTSTYPKFYPHLEASEDHELVVKKAVIYLGVHCDAIHSEFGTGTWEQDNGGFFVSFENGEGLRFSRQEMYGLDGLMESNCLWTPKDALSKGDDGGN